MRLKNTYQNTVFKRRRAVRLKPALQYVYCGNNPVNRIDPTGLDWFTDIDGTYQFNPDLNGDNQATILGEGQTYVGATYQVRDANGNVIENYRKDGSIMFSNESAGYKRIWNNTQKTGNEEMGVITDKGVLVTPDYKNTFNDSSPIGEKKYNYSFSNGNIVDADGNSFNTLGTIHTHTTLIMAEGKVKHEWMGPSGEDYETFGTHTPGTPFFVITPDRNIHSYIPKTPTIATPLDLQGRGKTIEGIIFRHYSLKHIGR